MYKKKRSRFSQTGMPYMAGKVIGSRGVGKYDLLFKAIHRICPEYQIYFLTLHRKIRVHSGAGGFCPC